MPRIGADPWTAEMVRAFPSDGNRYEVIDGELLVTPSPAMDHQAVVGAIFAQLYLWTREQGVGETMMSPADIELEPRGLVQPDVFVIPLMGDGPRPRGWREVTRLALAIEVLSPSSVRDDRTRKRTLFARVGVPEYWIVNPAERVVERWRPGDDLPELCNRTLSWHPSGAGEAFVIDLPSLFRAALD